MGPPSPALMILTVPTRPGGREPFVRDAPEQARTGYLPAPAACRTDLFVHHDITDQIDKPDMRQPSERKDPTENKEPAEPTLPTDSTEPIEPTESTDPREPMERTESRDHSDQRELSPVFDMRSSLAGAFAPQPGVSGPNSSDAALWLIGAAEGPRWELLAGSIHARVRFDMPYFGAPISREAQPRC
jgi:hypothetical protein